MTAVNVTNLFPLPIGSAVYEEPLDDELLFLKALKRTSNIGNETTEDNYVFKRKELQAISEFCNDALQSYFYYVHCPKNDVRPYITQSWGNFSTKNQFHHKHHHPNSFISGVFYLEADQEKDKIFFFNDRRNQIDVMPQEWNVYNSKSWFYQTPVGLLLLWHSHLEHSVDAIDTDRTRVSIAFNSFLMGSLGNTADLTELIL